LSDTSPRAYLWFCCFVVYCIGMPGTVLLPSQPQHACITLHRSIFSHPYRIPRRVRHAGLLPAPSTHLPPAATLVPAVSAGLWRWRRCYFCSNNVTQPCPTCPAALKGKVGWPCYYSVRGPLRAMMHCHRSVCWHVRKQGCCGWQPTVSCAGNSMGGTIL
jgi:hypothetical protein